MENLRRLLVVIIFHKILIIFRKKFRKYKYIFYSRIFRLLLFDHLYLLKQAF
jgi:hypothetical protein